MAPTVPSSKRTTSTNNGDADEEEVRPYVIGGVIGNGSFATVYKGYHEVRYLCLQPRLVAHGRTENPTACSHQDREA
jgi:hypothetical protein